MMKREACKNLLSHIEHRLMLLYGRLITQWVPAPTVLPLDETLKTILHEGKSICRFGDGEFNIIFGGEIGFQKHNKELAIALQEILQNPTNACLIGIPGVFKNMSMYRKNSKHFWYYYRGKNQHRIYKLIDKELVYADTNVTRFQTGFDDKLNKESIITLFKQIWNEREVVFIEGAMTRMGIGNDLFDNVRRIERILMPPEDAFEKLKEAEEYVENNISKEKLIIIACGPTATVLAYDLSQKGYQALDLGHLDIQYDHFIRGASERISVPGKYTNETAQREVAPCEDQKYVDSILVQIE